MSKDPTVENRPILVVEDDQDLAEIVVRRLQSEGYAAECVHTWEEGRKRLEAGLPDLLLMDLNLPDADGMEVIESLRADERTRRLAIVVASARDATDQLVRGIRSEVMYFITKPYELEEMVRKIRSALFQRFESVIPGGTTDRDDSPSLD
jgi:DNA-binding response OmpR family regulator